MTIGTEKAGGRIYVTGDTYAIRATLKGAGCHWDAERKQWWIGAAKAEAIEKIVAKAASGETAPPKEDLSSARVYGKVAYKGKPYYVIGESRDGHKYRLAMLSGEVNFWADSSACEWSRRYEPRRGYGGRVEHQTLGGIRRFIERQKNPATSRVECPECGSWHNATESCRDCGGC